ncbi:MAG: 16S rRNA (cytosine(967)-C(5))-methyltransferase [Spirulina sp. SIO3F2]|nr:16S rRNA (cytosine(967)-C(5))-methyltransferase [Spirulina sp. SIO3F2]
MNSPQFPTARWVAFQALWQITRQDAYTDVALNRALQQASQNKNTEQRLNPQDRGLVTELVYGCVRRQRTLDALIDQLGKRPAAQQPPKLRLVMHLGLYQLRYLDHVPPSAAVNTSVDLAKALQLKKLAGVVNGMLRQYLRATEGQSDILKLPTDPVAWLGVKHSFPNWLIAQWSQDYGLEQTEQFCDWFNQPATIDLRVNPLQTTRSQLQTDLKAAGVLAQPVAAAPQALRLVSSPGAIPKLPGFNAGHWTVQESSAQLVTHLLDPQPGETVIDACAAPGGKTTHIAELMQNQGEIIACDRTPHRLKKVTANAKRLQLEIVTTHNGDSTQITHWRGDRVLLDVPCSGLGTLHRHPDIRWRQTPETIAELATLQTQLLNQASTWLKPGGHLVYATCTLNPQENEAVIKQFLATHPDWAIAPPEAEQFAPFRCPEGWLKVLPHQHHMDGFFMVALVQGSE